MSNDIFSGWEVLVYMLCSFMLGVAAALTLVA